MTPLQAKYPVGITDVNVPAHMIIVPTGVVSKYLAIGKALIEETFVMAGKDELFRTLNDDILAVILTPRVLILAVVILASGEVIDTILNSRPALIVDVVIAPAFIVEILPLLRTFRFVVLTVAKEPVVMFARGPLIVLRNVTVPS